MQRRFGFLMLAMLLLVGSPAWAGRILVLGDSLSAAYGMDPDKGWVSLLSKRLADEHPEWEVINASASGETTAGGRSRLGPLLVQHKPDILVLALGSNDGLRAFGLRTIKANLEHMAEAGEESGARVMVLGAKLPPNYGAAYTKAFHELFVDVAEDMDLALVPFLLEHVAIDRSLMQGDGYHPTAAAQPQLLQNVWPKLQRLLQ